MWLKADIVHVIFDDRRESEFQVRQAIDHVQHSYDQILDFFYLLTTTLLLDLDLPKYAYYDAPP